jgi:hypothetical protein
MEMMVENPSVVSAESPRQRARTPAAARETRALPGELR